MGRCGQEWELAGEGLQHVHHGHATMQSRAHAHTHARTKSYHCMRLAIYYMLKVADHLSMRRRFPKSLNQNFYPVVKLRAVYSA